MNIAIVRAFIALREMVFFYKEMAEQMSAIRNRLGEHDSELNAIYEATTTCHTESFCYAEERGILTSASKKFFTGY